MQEKRVNGLMGMEENRRNCSVIVSKKEIIEGLEEN